MIGELLGITALTSLLFILLIMKWQAFDKEYAPQSDERACNIAGHEYQPKCRPHYHSRGVPYYGAGDSFKITKHSPMKCVKCGAYKEEKEVVGRVFVDNDTDTLKVCQ